MSPHKKKDTNENKMSKKTKYQLVEKNEHEILMDELFDDKKNSAQILDEIINSAKDKKVVAQCNTKFKLIFRKVYTDIEKLISESPVDLVDTYNFLNLISIFTIFYSFFGPFHHKLNFLLSNLKIEKRLKIDKIFCLYKLYCAVTFVFP